MKLNMLHFIIHVPEHFQNLTSLYKKRNQAAISTLCENIVTL